MPQMAPLAWMNLFYFVILIFSLVSIKLYFLPSHYNLKSSPSLPSLTGKPGLSKSWEW